MIAKRATCTHWLVRCMNAFTPKQQIRVSSSWSVQFDSVHEFKFVSWISVQFSVTQFELNYSLALCAYLTTRPNYDLLHFLYCPSLWPHPIHPPCMILDMSSAMRPARCDDLRRNRHVIHKERNTLGHCNTFGTHFIFLYCFVRIHRGEGQDRFN